MVGGIAQEGELVLVVHEEALDLPTSKQDGWVGLTRNVCLAELPTLDKPIKKAAYQHRKERVGGIVHEGELGLVVDDESLDLTTSKWVALSREGSFASW